METKLSTVVSQMIVDAKIAKTKVEDVEKIIITAMNEVANEYEAKIKELEAKVIELSKPKKTSSRTTHKPLLDNEGNVMAFWCRFHGQYEPVELMVLTKDGKSKGYCRASYSTWNKAQSQVKKLNAEAASIMLDDIEAAQELALKARDIKNRIDNLDIFDFKNDWLNYGGKKPDSFAIVDTFDNIDSFENVFEWYINIESL